MVFLLVYFFPPPQSYMDGTSSTSDYPTKHFPRISLRMARAACCIYSFISDQNAQHGRHSISLVHFLVDSNRTGVPLQGNRDPACLIRALTLAKVVQNTIELCCFGLCGGSALQAGSWEERFYECVSFKVCVKKKKTRQCRAGEHCQTYCETLRRLPWEGFLPINICCIRVTRRCRTTPSPDCSALRKAADLCSQQSPLQ